MWRIVMMAILCMQLVACSTATDLLGKVGGGSATNIIAAVEKCNLTSSQYVGVMDDGHSLMLDGRSDSSSVDGIEISDTSCVLQQLGIPAYITMLMSNTRSVDGMQREEYDAYKIYWNYHPDNGLDIIIHMK
jgi:hypothetical protein